MKGSLDSPTCSLCVIQRESGISSNQALCGDIKCVRAAKLVRRFLEAKRGARSLSLC